uniref:Uncharacterized protein n=1 Tax=Arion vulgaris TaxID=1028688 RepID=A0A0B7AE91_9EUPU
MRLQGRPLMSYKDICKTSMKNVSISPNKWEQIADDQVIWYALQKGAESFEDKLRDELEGKRNKHKLGSHHSNTLVK